MAYTMDQANALLDGITDEAGLRNLITKVIPKKRGLSPIVSFQKNVVCPRLFLSDCFFSDPIYLHKPQRLAATT